MSRKRPCFRLVSLVTMLCACNLSAQAQMHGDVSSIGTRNINNGRFGFPNQLTVAQEYQQGSKMDAQLRKKQQRTSHPQVEQYLQQIANEIVNHSDFRGPVQVYLNRQQDNLAFATMGGYLYLQEDLFRIAANESELAGVLAHEIGHLAARHAAENLSRKYLLQGNPTWIETLLRPYLSLAGHVNARGLAGLWIVVGYGNEIEADELATQYLWNCGFDPEGLLALMTRIQDENWLDRSGGLWRSSSHPPLALRQRRIREVLKILPPLAAGRLNSSRFVELQDLLRSNFTRLHRQ